MLTAGDVRLKSKPNIAVAFAIYTLNHRRSKWWMEITDAVMWW